MKEKVKITEYLSSDKGFSTMVVNELLVVNNATGEKVIKPCLIFKEFEENIAKVKELGDVKIVVKYEFYNLGDTWCMPIVIRLGEKELNTYMSFYDLNSVENVELLTRLNSSKDLGIVFYNERMEVTHTLTMRENPFYQNINAVLSEIGKSVFTEERGIRFNEIKRQVLKTCENSAINYYNGIIQ